jgi:plastocyanin
MTQSSLSRRDLLSAGGAAVAAALAGCTSGSDGDDGDSDADATVEVGPDGDFVFTPGTDEPLRVDSGATVLFDWKSGSHNVVVDSQPSGANWEGHAGIEGSGFSFTHTFETPGTYEYVCEPHESLGMVGTLVVEE